LSSAITRQIRPHWNAPSGADAERLVSVVNWDLNRDGTLRGTPRCRVDPASITDSNRPQASLHCERAIRAVQLASPFNLPEQFYDRWKALEWQFDRRL
jgi:periplasmic protein TonB